MDGTRVFVSGGAGVIGRELVTRLTAQGAEVFVGDLEPRPAAFDASVHYRQGDLNTLTGGELTAFGPEMFFHLAATFERSAETYEFWDENYRHNIQLSHHLMTLAKDLPCLRRVVFASSHFIYEPSLYQFTHQRETAVPLREDMPLLPRNLVGMAKLAHEIELRFLAGFRSDRFSTVCARIYRGYGCGSRDVISRWVRDLLAGRAIKVYRPEGIFDYVYAADSAEGLLRLADADAMTGIVNLGTGRARRVQDVVDILREHFPDMQAESLAADIPFEASQADMTAYEGGVGWLPDYDLETAIPEIISYERTRGAEAKTVALGDVLVSSASSKVPLVRAVQEAARRISPGATAVAGDISDDVLTSYVADSFWKMPRTEDSEVEALIAGCKERGIRVIVPTRDGELPFWADHRSRFEREGIHVQVASPQAVRLCLDKLAFAAFGKEHALPFIPAALDPAAVGAGPYVVKERFGAGSRQIGIDLTRDEAVEHGTTLSDPIYQPFVEGREISIDAWMDAGQRVKGLVLRHRDRVVNGESQVTTTFRDADIESQATAILEALQLRGPVVMQVLQDAVGGLHVIECNARFGGASTTAIEAGLDVFYWSLLEAVGADVAGYPFDRVPGELRLVRVPQDMTIHDPDL